MSLAAGYGFQPASVTTRAWWAYESVKKAKTLQMAKVLIDAEEAGNVLEVLYCRLRLAVCFLRASEQNNC